MRRGNEQRWVVRTSRLYSKKNDKRRTKLVLDKNTWQNFSLPVTKADTSGGTV
jgi:hypothetical protein